MKCQACQEREANVTLKDDVLYRLDHNCLFDLIIRGLNPEQWKNLTKEHGKHAFLLHSDYYDEDGIALQPARDYGTEREKEMTRIDFTLLQYTEDEVYEKGSRKQSFFLEELKSMDFKEEGNGVFAIREPHEGWVYVAENPWKQVNKKEK